MLNTEIGPQYVTCQSESSSKHFALYVSVNYTPSSEVVSYYMTPI